MDREPLETTPTRRRPKTFFFPEPYLSLVKKGNSWPLSGMGQGRGRLGCHPFALSNPCNK